jgi:hypothetical protein
MIVLAILIVAIFVIGLATVLIIVRTLPRYDE